MAANLVRICNIFDAFYEILSLNPKRKTYIFMVNFLIFINAPDDRKNAEVRK